jgi:hypothetical protein
LCGGSWCEDGAYLSAENFPFFSNFIFGRTNSIDGFVLRRTGKGELKVTGFSLPRK